MLYLVALWMLVATICMAKANAIESDNGNEFLNKMRNTCTSLTDRCVPRTGPRCSRDADCVPRAGGIGECVDGGHCIDRFGPRTGNNYVYCYCRDGCYTCHYVGK
ncbi:unnamed protein product [Adineta ricciae]|uniref:Uncharacterized protein n=1 Tax=Adineta ricciae TaxID=249248 RepID=A0A815WFY0_ADIRI|nr:unnamed protein product [Adineta ricciae]CAF1619247.1 unnamed protein product [Adineta ricciae]